MRITAEAKTATRQRILTVTVRLFRESGWESATTRDIAEAAGIANGTLFNYFKSKEAIGAALIEEAMAGADDEFRKKRTGAESLEEDLFLLIWTGLKSLRKYRAFLAPAAEAIFSPLAKPARDGAGAGLRVRHLEAAERILAEHGVARPLPGVVLQLYWTLYLGVLVYWASDESPHQEETLALLDRSLKLFAMAGTSPGAQGRRHRGRESE
jgi:AcrR family transcriptional regulator